MRKWQDLAAPDDPGSWYAVDGFQPTNRGTYETCDLATGTTYTATGIGAVTYAFFGSVPNPNSVNAEYVVASANKIFRYDSSAAAGFEFTDKTGAITVGLRTQMAQYGLITIAVMGSPRAALSGNDTVYASLGNNFAALTDAPKGDCICVQSNAVIIANTDVSNESWEASDVGDYTNWTSGEWFSGRIYDPPGPIKAAVSFGDAVYFFKANSIHRARYVGGSVKWETEKLFEGIGCSLTNQAVAGSTGILFVNQKVGFGGVQDAGHAINDFYFFDGVNYPTLVNPITSVASSNYANSNVGGLGAICYNRNKNVFVVADTGATDTALYFFSPDAMAWGKSTVSYGASPGLVIPQETDGGFTYGLPIGFIKSAANTIKRYAVAPTSAPVSYIQTSMMGAIDTKTTFNRVIPRTWRRVDRGTDSVALSVDLFRELHDTSAATTISVTEATNRKRFDFQGTDNFARFKLTYTDIDAEIEDVVVKGRPAGTD